MFFPAGGKAQPPTRQLGGVILPAALNQVQPGTAWCSVQGVRKHRWVCYPSDDGYSNTCVVVRKALPSDCRRGVSPRVFRWISQRRAVRHRAYSRSDALRATLTWPWSSSRVASSRLAAFAFGLSDVDAEEFGEAAGF